MPPRGEAAVLDSIVMQAARHQAGAEPSQDLRQKLLDRALREWPHVSVPSHWVPDAEGAIQWDLVRERVVNILRNEIKSDASPGFPLSNIGDNTKVIETMGEDFIVSVVISRLKLLLCNDCLGTPMSLVDESLCDAVSLFVKNEPHPEKKFLSKRWRLISSVSLVDQVIDRLLHTRQNKVEIFLWYKLPSLPGMGLTTETDYKRILRAATKRAEKHGTGIACADVSGFDWSIKEWQIMLDAEIRTKLMRGCPSYVRDLMMRRARCLCRTLYSTPQGKLISQDVLGVVKSGTFNTSSTNSRVRVLMAWAVGAEWCVAMGDDSLEAPVEHAVEKYAELGHRVTDYNVAEDTFEFCSHTFHMDGSGWYPTDPVKSLYGSGVKGFRAEADQALRNYVQRHPHRDKYLEVLDLIERHHKMSSPEIVPAGNSFNAQQENPGDTQGRAACPASCPAQAQ